MEFDAGQASASIVLPWNCSASRARRSRHPHLVNDEAPHYLRSAAGLATMSSSATSILCRRAAARIFRRACSLAVFDGKSVWFQRAIALRTWPAS